MAQLLASPSRPPVMATKVLNAYKAYARPSVPIAAARPTAVSPAGPRPASFAAPLARRAAAIFGPAPAHQDAHPILESMQRMLGALSRQGEQANPNFKELYGQYKRLSAAVKVSRPSRST